MLCMPLSRNVRTLSLTRDTFEQIAAIHYQQPEAVASIRNLDRVVELSHWGSNLAIQDNIDLTNSGPAYVCAFPVLLLEENLTT